MVGIFDEQWPGNGLNWGIKWGIGLFSILYLHGIGLATEFCSIHEISGSLSGHIITCSSQVLCWFRWVSPPPSETIHVALAVVTRGWLPQLGATATVSDRTFWQKCSVTFFFLPLHPSMICGLRVTFFFFCTPEVTDAQSALPLVFTHTYQTSLNRKIGYYRQAMNDFVLQGQIYWLYIPDK